jgi:hypothetical protein
MEVQRPEVKSESFTSSGSAVLETQDGADVSKWSQSEFSDQRHELSSQVTPELPSGYYGR